MTTLTPKNLIETIAETFPDFSKEYPPEESVGTYVYLDYFTGSLIDQIDGGGENSDFANNAFEFFNKMAAEGDDEVKNVLIVTALERLALSDEEKYIEISRKKLKGLALEYFERVLRGWADG